MKHTVTVVEAASLLNIGASTAYDAIKRGDFPCPVIRVGNRYLVPVRPLCSLLDISPDEITSSVVEEASA
ncbi:helix-turn-helix domain-containing protein [uncultured Corynebacterium sp.]|uniref:helix-turn-helix transcriptional regulator n=1 Tax=uncultured Corynebacterium sp. TaxID=159447 RepID=UPI0025CD92F9|nr:helix-turn-helix domain-containing protein [uncultured Corynebacterium sp.]